MLKTQLRTFKMVLTYKDTISFIKLVVKYYISKKLDKN